MRHRALFAWLLIGPFTFVLYSQAGFPLTFLSVGLILLGTTWVAMWLADKTSPERPVAALFATFWHDLSAPRARQRAHTATGASGWRPRGSLGRHVRRKEAQCDE